MDCMLSDPDRDEFAIVSAFLGYSPTLETVAISVHWLESDRICGDLSSKMPRLRELEVTVCCGFDPVDGSSILVDLTQDVLFTLARLTINGDLKLCAKRLLNMLIYRKTAEFELQHVILRCSEFIASDIEHGILLEMMDHGLCIEIFSE